MIRAIAFKKTLIKWELQQTVIMLAISVIMPVMVHMVPSFSAVPIGAMLIPMFYTPLIAIILFRPHMAIIAGLFSPLLNSLLTGNPTTEKILILTFELVLFSLIAYLIQRRWRYFCGAAVLAYVTTVLIVSCMLRSLDFFLSTIANSFVGIIILFLLNIILLQFDDKFHKD
jgi:hypothetical protein